MACKQSIISCIVRLNKINVHDIWFPIQRRKRLYLNQWCPWMTFLLSLWIVCYCASWTFFFIYLHPFCPLIQFIIASALNLWISSVSLLRTRHHRINQSHRQSKHCWLSLNLAKMQTSTLLIVERWIFHETVSPFRAREQRERWSHSSQFQYSWITVSALSSSYLHYLPLPQFIFICE